MWELKFLSGPQAGKKISLADGMFILGRDDKCSITIATSGISKEHAQIFVKGDLIEIEDMNSSNGTFLDGKQIRKVQLKEGDQVFLSSNIIFEIFKKPAPLMMGYPSMDSPARDHPELAQANPSTSKPPTNKPKGLIEGISDSIKNYVHESVLPGVYQLATWMEFKTLVACFVGAFVLLVISLSSVPLISILKSSIEQESLNNAETIAQSLVTANKEKIKKELLSGLNIDYALRRPGVKKALIISALDGRVLAPSHLAHTFPEESFIHSARKQDQKTVKVVDNSSEILAMVPISLYSPETGNSTPKAYSVIIYQMESLKQGVTKVFTLIAQASLIAFLLGAILFFFLIHLIEFPIRSINHQIGKALKEDQSPSIQVNYQSQVLSELCSHVNSALNQISLNKMIQSQQEELAVSQDRQQEMSHLVEVVGFPALAVNMEDKSIAALNTSFTEQLGLEDIIQEPLETLSEESLKEHLLQLIDQGELNPQEIAFGEFSFNENQFQSTCVFVMGSEAPAYAIVSFMPVESNEEVA